MRDHYDYDMLNGWNFKFPDWQTSFI